MLFANVCAGPVHQFLSLGMLRFWAFSWCLVHVGSASPLLVSLLCTRLGLLGMVLLDTPCGAEVCGGITFCYTLGSLLGSS